MSTKTNAVPRHMLVADDEENAVAQIRMFFSRRNFRISIAKDGQEAYERFLEDPADIMVTDYKMPRWDGLELIAKLRETHADLPIVVVTALPSSELRARLSADSLIRLVEKPVSLRLLEKAVRSFDEPAGT